MAQASHTTKGALRFLPSSRLRLIERTGAGYREQRMPSSTSTATNVPLGTPIHTTPGQVSWCRMQRPPAGVALTRAPAVLDERPDPICEPAEVAE